MFRSIIVAVLALSIPVAAFAADPTASPGHMTGHGATTGTAMKGHAAMKGHTMMKGHDAMKGGAMKGDAMHGAMKSPAPKAS